MGCSDTPLWSSIQPFDESGKHSTDTSGETYDTVGTRLRYNREYSDQFCCGSYLTAFTSGTGKTLPFLSCPEFIRTFRQIEYH
jgi:hypothetical protein